MFWKLSLLQHAWELESTFTNTQQAIQDKNKTLYEEESKPAKNTPVFSLSVLTPHLQGSIVPQTDGFLFVDRGRPSHDEKESRLPAFSCSCTWLTVLFIYLSLWIMVVFEINSPIIGSVTFSNDNFRLIWSNQV